MAVFLDGGSKSANATITGGGLTLGATNNSANGARGDTVRTSGKFAFEVTPNLLSLATDTGVGLSNSATPNYAALAATAANGAIIYRSGAVFINGVHVDTLSGIGGNAVMFAVDLDHNLLWIKVTDADGFNNGGNDPCTFIGGYDISGITGSLPGLYPVGIITSLANSEVFNFGATPLAHSLPPCYSTWDGSITPPVVSHHILQNARVPAFKSVLTAHVAGPPGSATLASVEPLDVLAGVLAPTVDATLIVSEDADVMALVGAVVAIPPYLDDADRIYVLQDRNIFVPAGGLTIAIPGNGIIPDLPTPNI